MQERRCECKQTNSGVAANDTIRFTCVFAGKAAVPSCPCPEHEPAGIAASPRPKTHVRVSVIASCSFKGGQVCWSHALQGQRGGMTSQTLRK